MKVPVETITEHREWVARGIFPVGSAAAVAARPLPRILTVLLAIWASNFGRLDLALKWPIGLSLKHSVKSEFLLISSSDVKRGQMFEADLEAEHSSRGHSQGQKFWP